jgi:hypothetical protein
VCMSVGGISVDVDHQNVMSTYSAWIPYSFHSKGIGFSWTRTSCMAAPSEARVENVLIRVGMNEHCA